MSGEPTKRLRSDALAIYLAAVRAADPLASTKAALSEGSSDGCGTDRFDLSPESLGLLAFGKAAEAMTLGALQSVASEPPSRGPAERTRQLHASSGKLSGKLSGKPCLRGLVVGPRGASALFPDGGPTGDVNQVDGYAWGTRFAPEIDLRTAGHPWPDRSSVDAGQAIERWVSSPKWARLLVLISGGGSALVCAPAPGLPFEDKLEATRLVMEAGASIGELNTVRKHLSRIKGGGLARLVDGRPVFCLVLSDVVDDDLPTVASGPLVGDPTTFEQALEIVSRLGVRRALPASVLQRLEAGASGQLPETPKPGDASFESIQHRIVGGNRTSVEAAAREAETLGYRVERVEEAIVGEARDAGRRLAVVTESARSTGRWALIGGGETTVQVSGAGRGGRNQELALALAWSHSEARVAASDDWVFLSAGTDGIDGPTDAAGAIVDAGTCGRALAESLDPQQILDDNDTYRLLEATGDLLRTGPTGTNVADIQIYLRESEGAET